LLCFSKIQGLVQKEIKVGLKCIRKLPLKGVTKPLVKEVAQLIIKHINNNVSLILTECSKLVSCEKYQRKKDFSSNFAYFQPPETIFDCFERKALEEPQKIIDFIKAMAPAKGVQL
jgi:hypothetical protein